MPKLKTKRIAFRVDEILYDFLKEFAEENNLDLSKLVRNILIYFHVGFMIGAFNENIAILKQRWREIYQTDKSKFRVKGVDKLIKENF